MRARDQRAVEPGRAPRRAFAAKALLCERSGGSGRIPGAAMESPAVRRLVAARGQVQVPVPRCAAGAA